MVFSYIAWIQFPSVRFGWLHRCVTDNSIIISSIGRYFLGYSLHYLSALESILVRCLQDRFGKPYPPFHNSTGGNIHNRLCMLQDCVTASVTSWKESMSAAGMMLDISVCHQSFDKFVNRAVLSVHFCNVMSGYWYCRFITAYITAACNCCDRCYWFVNVSLLVWPSAWGCCESAVQSSNHVLSFAWYRSVCLSDMTALFAVAIFISTFVRTSNCLQLYRCVRYSNWASSEPPCHPRVAVRATHWRGVLSIHR